MDTIYPCIWFNGDAKAAAELYCSLFKNSRITVDTSMVVNFELDGQKLMGLNGGPQFKPNPSISFFAVFETEEETLNAWEAFSAGGSVLMPLGTYDWSEKYGWVQDRFGVSWQVSLGKLKDVGQRITACIMFGGEQHSRAEEAIQLYTAIFQPASVAGILRYVAGEEGPEGTVKHAQFTIRNYVLMVMDSAATHSFHFNEAISFVVSCETQEEIDHYWERLTEGGEEGRCGWLKDRFGISWQIVPAALGKLMSDPGRSKSVSAAFMQMKKPDIEKLKTA